MARIPQSKPVTFGQAVTHGDKEEEFENPRLSRLSISREPSSYSHYDAVQFQKEFNNHNNHPFVVEYPTSSKTAKPVSKKVGTL